MKNRFSRRTRPRGKEVRLGFQIAPMVDLIFVILLFFIVAAGSLEKEAGRSVQLPGWGGCGFPGVEVPDPFEIQIDASGVVTLFEEEFPGNLEGFRDSIRDLGMAAQNLGHRPIVYVMAAEETKYQRVVDVLEVLADERITDVSFQVGTPE